MKKLYVKFHSNNLQVFFAVLSFVEKYNKNYVFIYDNINKKILEECEKHINFQLLNINECKDIIEIIEIKTNHELPLTIIQSEFESTLIFPKLINDLYFVNDDEKINKIYFRGLFTLSRFIEIAKLLFRINDFKGLIILFSNILFRKKEYIISTNRVFINFTTRGRISEFKYLDNDYYAQMSKYRFIFCPKGDYIWTYRFFEAILVGGLPICIKVAESYQGFKFIYLNKFSMQIRNINNIDNLNLLKKRFYLK